MAMGGLIDHKY